MRRLRQGIGRDTGPRVRAGVLCALALALCIPVAFAAASQITGPDHSTAGAGAVEPRCEGRRATVSGTDRDDDLTGTAGPDVIVAMGGADRIRGLGGEDLLCGGDGGDVVDGGTDDDVLRGGAGADRLSGRQGRDRLFGDHGEDSLDGGADTDRCRGGKGSDAITHCEPASKPKRAATPAVPDVPAVNRPPTATDIAISTDEDTAISIDVLAAASDPDGDAVTLALLDASAAKGEVVASDGGTIRFDPSDHFDSLAAEEPGSDSFEYTIADSHGMTAKALVTVTIIGLDDQPVAIDDSAVLTENDDATSIDVKANDLDPDGGPASIASVSEPDHGTASIAGGATEILYQPEPGYCNDGEAADNFSYTLSGGSSAVVDVTVACVTTVSTSPALFPSFDPLVSDYTVRCDGTPIDVFGRTAAAASISVDSGDAVTGHFETTVPLGENEEFDFVVEDEDYHVRCLPSGFPTWDYDRLLQPAHSFYVVTPLGESGPLFAVVFDDNGVPVWWHLGTPKPVDAKVLADGSIAWWGQSASGDGYEIRNLNGEILRVISAFGGSTDFHELQQDHDGDFLIASYQPRSHVDLTAYGGGADDTVVDAVVEEIDPAGNEIWRWNSKDHISLDETGRWWPNVLKQGSRDIVHINAVEPVGDDAVMLSLRHTDAVYKIDKDTGEVIWKLGGTWTPESLNVLGDPEGAYPLGGPHDIRLLADGTITIHANNTGFLNPPRAVRYAIDEAAGTATLLEAVTDPEAPSSPCCGSARRSPDGSWLLGWGGNSLVTEFNAAGQRTFRLGFGGTTFTYRAVAAPDGVLTAAALRAGMDFMHPR